jgi:tetratricopeptide (TPR) repeat protein
VALLVLGAWLRYFAGLPPALNRLPPVGLFLLGFLAFAYWSRVYLRWRALLVTLLLVAIASGATTILVRELAYRTITTTEPCTVRSASESVGHHWVVSRYRGLRRVTNHTYDVTWKCGETWLDGTSRFHQGVDPGQTWEMTYDPSGRLAMRPADDGPALPLPAGVAIGGIWLLFLVRRVEEGALLDAAERHRLTQKATRRARETLENGIALYEGGDHAQAVEVLTDAVAQLNRLRLLPALTDALHSLGSALAAAGDPRAAAHSLETAAALAARIEDGQRHADAAQELSRIKAQLTRRPRDKNPGTGRGDQRRRATPGVSRGTGTFRGTGTSRAGHAFYRIAATAGDVTAMHRLGRRLHDEGRTAEARQWLRRAADAGYRPSQLALDRWDGEERGR